MEKLLVGKISIDQEHTRHCKWTMRPAVVLASLDGGMDVEGAGEEHMVRWPVDINTAVYDSKLSRIEHHYYHETSLELLRAIPPVPGKVRNW